MGLGRPAGKVIEVSVRFKRGAKEELEATPGTLRRQNSQPWRHGVRGEGEAEQPGLGVCLRGLRGWWWGGDRRGSS